MKPHDTFLQLAAIAIDFPLDTAERRGLDQHLAGCPACALAASMLRQDAVALTHLPPVTLPERRAAGILTAAMRPAPMRATGRLLVIAALLGLLLLGSLAAGAELLRRMNEDDDLSVVPPVPSLATDDDPSLSPPADTLVGTSWSRVQLPGAATSDRDNGSMGGVIAGGPGAIAWGTTYGRPSQVWTSGDGVSWSEADVEAPGDPDPEAGYPGTISTITTGGPGFVAVGSYDRAGTGRRGLIWTSEDGRRWDLVPHDASFEHVLLDAVVSWRGELHAYGQDSAGADEGQGNQRSWTSRDGIAWQPAELATPDGFRLSLPIVGVDRLWGFGYPAAEVPVAESSWTLTRWLQSTDGVTWTDSGLPRYPGALYPLPGGLLTLLQPFATSGDSAPPDAASRPAPGVYRSIDERTWAQVWTGTTMHGYDLVEVGDTLVVVGDDSAGDPECWADCQAMGWRSTDDGRTWEPVPADVIGGTMTDVASLGDGTLVAVGRLLDERGSPNPAAWVSAPMAPAVSPTPSPVRSASPVPSAPAASGPVVAPASLPLPSGSVSLAAAPTGGVWVLVNDPPDLAGESGRAVLALLAADGVPAPGWPQEIGDVVCSIRAGIPASPASRLPLVAPDGSVRLLCRTASPDATPAVFALSFDAAGTPSPGWPVRLPADPVDARMVGDTLVLATSEATTDADGNLLEGEFRILRVSAPGQLERGQAAAMDRNSSYDPTLAADGVAFQRWVHDEGADPATEILAFGFDGALPGWPVSVPGIVSAPVLGPDGRYYATASARASYDALAPDQALVALTPSGSLSVGLDLPVAGISEATFAGGYAPLRPELEAGGSAWVLGVDTRDNVVVHALGPNGAIRGGWPWSAGAPIEEQGECGQETGCGVWRTVPALGPGGVFLVLLAPADSRSGGRVVAVGPDGRVVDGWPVTLTNPGGRWDVVVASADGTVYATAIEAGGRTSTTTLLAIAPDSEVAWRSTLVGD